MEHLLGIKKLPDAASKLADGRIYVVLHDAKLGMDVVCQTVVSACALGRTEWIAETPSAYLDAPAELKREVAECLRDGELRIFHAKAGERRRMFGDILKELDHLGTAKGSLILVEGVDRFVEQEAPEKWEADVAAWQKWAERTECAVLWLCPLRVGTTGHEADFLRVAHHFSGCARLRKAGSEVRWDVYYWFANEGMLADKSFHLETDGNGSWWVEERDMQRADANEPAVDEDDVFIMRESLSGDRSVPGSWRVFDTAERMSVALSSARAATVVFYYNQDSSLETLARSIFELRCSTGPYLKIAVKESGGRLRHSHEQMLLSMGCNLTIPADTGFARMQSLLKSMQGQIYSRVMPSSFEEAMSSVMAVAQKGYLAPPDFVDAVSDVLERTAAMEVHNALVRFSLTDGLSILETLRCCTMKRHGDMYTADDKSVYVFLFACEEQNIGTTLDRVFRLPVSVLFSGELRYMTAEDIASALDEFNQRITKTNQVDFTAELACSASADAGLPSEAVTSATSVKTSTHRPFAAVPHALTLRAVPA